MNWLKSMWNGKPAEGAQSRPTEASTRASIRKALSSINQDIAKYEKAHAHAKALNSQGKRKEAVHLMRLPAQQARRL